METCVEKIAKAIRLPANKWAGMCAGVSKAVLEKGLVVGSVKYGYYYDSVLNREWLETYRSVGLCQHSWFEVQKGLVYDPTRWDFEDQEPYIYVGKDSGYKSLATYDPTTGEFVRDTDPPSFDPKFRAIEFPEDEVAWKVLGEVSPIKPFRGILSADQLLWLFLAPKGGLGGQGRTIANCLSEVWPSLAACGRWSEI